MNPKISFKDRKMVIFTATGPVSQFYGDLMYIIFDKPDCLLHFSDDIIYRVEVPMKYIMEHLPEAPFIKCRRSTIVNLCYFKSINKFSLELTMNNNEKIKLTKQNVNAIISKVGYLPRISPPCSICYSCDDVECDTQMVFCRRKEKKA